MLGGESVSVDKKFTELRLDGMGLYYGGENSGRPF